jgi:hypothetical protein
MDFIWGDRTSIGTPVTTRGVDLSRKIRSGHPPAAVLIENAGDFEVEGHRAIGHLSVTAQQTDESCTLLDRCDGVSSRFARSASRLPE